MIAAWMTPAEEARTLRIAAARAGCRVDGSEVRTTLAGPRLAGLVSCANGWGAARFLLAASAEDAKTAGARDLALSLRARAPSDDAFARLVHRYVSEGVRFVREPGEVFAGASYTLAAGAGDCDDHARVAYALLRAGGLPARLAFLYKRGSSGPSHVVAQAFVGGAWAWLETTLPAAFGEHPYDAARRVGVLGARSDVASEVRTMTERDLPPVPAGFDDRNPTDLVSKDAAALAALGFVCLSGVAPAADDPEFRGVVATFQTKHGLPVDGLIGPATRHAIGAALVAGHAAEAAGYLGAIGPAPLPEITDDFVAAVGAMAQRLGISPTDFLLVSNFESGGINSHAANPAGAYGLIQIANLPGVGWTDTPAAFRALDPLGQLPYVERYLRSFAAAKLTPSRRLHQAIYLPATLGAGSAPDLVLAAADGARWPNRLGVPQEPAYYEANKGFDTARKGWITPADLEAAELRASKTARFQAVLDQVARVLPAYAAEAARLKAAPVPAAGSPLPGGGMLLAGLVLAGMVGAAWWVSST